MSTTIANRVKISVNAGKQAAGDGHRDRTKSYRKSVRHHMSRSQSDSTRKSTYSLAGHLIVDLGPGQATFQPTYRLEPARPIAMDPMRVLLEQTVLGALANQAFDKYNAAKASRFCQSVSREIMLRFRAHEFDRFRAIAVVTMTEKNNQCVHTKTGFEWDAEWDTWSDYLIEMKTFFMHACLFLVYYE